MDFYHMTSTISKFLTDITQFSRTRLNCQCQTVEVKDGSPVTIFIPLLAFQWKTINSTVVVEQMAKTHGSVS